MTNAEFLNYLMMIMTHLFMVFIVNIFGVLTINLMRR